MRHVKYSLQILILGNRALLTWLLVLLVLGVQLLVAAHASQHVFHEVDESCILYSTSEHSPAADVYLPQIKHEYRADGLLINRSVGVSRAILLTSNQSRAPPASL